ncbi:MAG: bifunctional riboflavin kinase/FAD synthetase [Alkalimonas sp.]|nr:bifunctional riboflavin kinase/FAD synthetase [Alkalimonas sp.]
MEFIRGLHNIKPEHQGCVLTIGNFDGVHLGHQAVLAKLQAVAQQRQLPSCVMVFEPQPLELFAPERAPARLSRLREKYHGLARFGVERLLCVNFNQRFADLDPAYFVEQLLVQQLGVRHLIVGDDFCFGKNRTGNYGLLQQASERFGFGLTPTASLKQHTHRVSSTRIRQALAQDDLLEAQAMLGRPFALMGRVRHGRQLGRELGFPTANVWLYRRKLPVHGVYAIEASTPYGDFQGVANIGSRPTVSGKTEQLEAHLFDFSDNLYGCQIEVRLRQKIRNEQSFASLEALQQQIQRDAEAARNFFKSSASVQVEANEQR